MINEKNKMVNEIKHFALIFMPINWIICIIVTIILFITLDQSYGFGYMLGSVTSYLTFGLHMKNANDYGDPKANIFMKLFTNVGVRLLLSALVLFISYKFNHLFNFVTCAVGICVIKVFLVVFALVYFIVDNKKKKQAQEEIKEEGSVEEANVNID